MSEMVCQLLSDLGGLNRKTAYVPLITPLKHGFRVFLPTEK